MRPSRKFPLTPCEPGGVASESVPALLAKSRMVGALIVDAKGKIRRCNSAFARMLGYSSPQVLTGISFADDLLIDSDYWNRSMSADIDYLEMDQSLQRFDGETVAVCGDARLRRDQSGQAIGFEAMVINCTEQQRANRIAEDASTLHALGSLTSGIAHDFNNLLTVIVGNLYLLVEGVRENEALSKKAKNARDAAKRGADLTRRLLSFARLEPGVQKQINVATTIGDVQSLLERTLGPRIVLKSQIAEEIWPIRVDVAQFESAIINLAVNARDAMRDGGTLLFNVNNVTLDSVKLVGNLDPGDYVVVSVTDDGPGIPEVIKDRVFEPFFSTKTDRGGNGLGLSMVRQFVTEAKGWVGIVSKRDRGTTVKLVLPRAPLDANDTLTLSGTQPLSTLATGEESVLVLSSDAHIRHIVRELLAALGYSITVVSNTNEVYQALQHQQMDLLLSDAIPGPGVSANELMEKTRRAAPSIGIILMSDDANSKQSLNQLPAEVMPKPFSLEELAATVRRVLDSRS